MSWEYSLRNGKLGKRVTGQGEALSGEQRAVSNKQPAGSSGIFKMQSPHSLSSLFVGISALVLLVCTLPWRADADSNASAYRDALIATGKNSWPAKSSAYGGDLAFKISDRGWLSHRAQGDDLKLTDEDRAEIISQMLKREIARIKEERAKYDKRRKGILTLTLSTQKLKPSLVPSIPGVKFILIEPEEIEKRVKGAFGISYLAFDTFEAKGPVVTVSLSNADRGPGRVRTFVYIKQNKYEYRKEDGKWVGKLINSGALISD
jgi:hypothetical protein